MIDALQVKVMGIDLATKNCGICWRYRDDSSHMSMCGMKTQTDIELLVFSKILKSLVKDQTVYVDFNFNEVFLPGRKKFTAYKYFLAGIIQASAKECNLITPSQLRKHYYCNSKMSKKDLHKLLIPEIMLEQYNEHELDAYLLAKMYKG